MPHSKRNKIFLKFSLLAMLPVFFFSDPAGALEPGLPVGKYFDMRLTAGAGLFYYPQYVDGGFYVNNSPYDLEWYGWQAQITGEVQFFIPWNRKLSAGIGGGYFSGLSPSAMDKNRQIHVDAGKNARGGFLGGSASYWFDNIRLNLLFGYGGTGVSDYYGGYGFTLSIGGTYLFPNGSFIGGLGLRFLFMNLSSSGDSETRGEKGGYFALLAEASIDWTH